MSSAPRMSGALSGRHRVSPAAAGPERAPGSHRLPRRRQAEARDLAPAVQPQAFWRYIAFVTVAGALVLINAAVSGGRHHVRLDASYGYVVLLLVVAELRPLVKSNRRDPAGLTTSEAFVFALLLHWGLTPALMAMVGALVLGDAFRRRKPWRTAFNVAQYALAYAAAALVLIGCSVDIDDHGGRSIGAHDLPAVALAGLAFFVVNDFLVAGAVALHKRQSLKAVLLDAPAYRIISTAALLCLSPLLVVVAERSSGFLPLLLVPLYAVGQAAALAQERERQALHDPLTGLANRTQLLERAGPAVSGSSQVPQVALLMVDLDGFKQVNDTYGHLAGDELLRLVGARLSAAVRPGDMVARFGGDEFAVLLSDLSPDSLPELHGRERGGRGAPALPPEEVAAAVAGRIRQALREPYQIGEMALTVGASVGTAVAVSGCDIDALLHAADVDMYAVKSRRRRAADAHGHPPARGEPIVLPDARSGGPAAASNGALPKPRVRTRRS